MFPAPIRLFIICSLVPLIVETIAIMDAMPIMTPSIVRKERIL